MQTGGGKHIYCLPPGQIYPVLKWSLLAQVCNVLGIGLVKISVCLCVLRLIDRARRRLSQFLWVLVAFVAASHSVQVLIFLLQCRPLNALWDPKVKGTCFSAHVVYTAGYTNYGKTPSVPDKSSSMTDTPRTGRTHRPHLCWHSGICHPPVAYEHTDEDSSMLPDESRRFVSGFETRGKMKEDSTD